MLFHVPVSLTQEFIDKLYSLCLFEYLLFAFCYYIFFMYFLSAFSLKLLVPEYSFVYIAFLLFDWLLDHTLFILYFSLSLRFCSCSCWILIIFCRSCLALTFTSFILFPMIGYTCFLTHLFHIYWISLCVFKPSVCVCPLLCCLSLLCVLWVL